MLTEALTIQHVGWRSHTGANFCLLRTMLYVRALARRFRLRFEMCFGAPCHGDNLCDTHFANVLGLTKARSKAGSWTAKPAWLAKTIEEARDNTHTHFVNVIETPHAKHTFKHMRDYREWMFMADGRVVARQHAGADASERDATADFERARWVAHPLQPYLVSAAAPPAVGLMEGTSPEDEEVHDQEEFEDDEGDDEEDDDDEDEDDHDIGDVVLGLERRRGLDTIDLLSWTKPVVVHEVTKWADQLGVPATKLPAAAAGVREWRQFGTALLNRACGPGQPVGAAGGASPRPSAGAKRQTRRAARRGEKRRRAMEREGDGEGEQGG